MAFTRRTALRGALLGAWFTLATFYSPASAKELVHREPVTEAVAEKTTEFLQFMTELGDFEPVQVDLYEDGRVDVPMNEQNAWVYAQVDLETWRAKRMRKAKVRRRTRRFWRT